MVGKDVESWRNLDYRAYENRSSKQIDTSQLSLYCPTISTARMVKFQQPTHRSYLVDWAESANLSN